VKGKQPEWWDAETGSLVSITTFSSTKAGITIPLNLGAQASAFKVFQKPMPQANMDKKEIAAKDIIYTSKGLVTTQANFTNPVTLKGP
jgi:hypothetical protein